MSTQLDALTSWSGDDRYLALSVLGRGANGLVIRARDRRTGDDVAIKVLRRQSPSALRRMRAEFDAIASIAHRNLLSLYELDARRDPWLLVMEPIDGAPLLASSASTARSLTRATMAERTLDSIDDESEAPPHDGASFDALSVGTLAERFIALCDGLEALHSRGVLHLDIKPANVLIERGSERVVIVDLGLAHQHADASFSLAGTPAYLSPELLEHRSPTAAADRYAVGVMLFEAIARRWPFGGSAAQILARKRCERAPSLRAAAGDRVPAALDELCAALLDRDPDARPSLDDVRRALGSLVAKGSNSRDLVSSRAESSATVELGDRDGRGLCATLLTHESAVTRSAALASVATSLEQEGAVVVHARCDRDARVRFALLDRLVRGCVAIERDDALVSVVDDLVMGLAEDRASVARAVDAIAALVDRISARRSMAFVVSEAHEADLESVAIIAPLALRTRARTRWFFSAHPAAEPLEPLCATLGSAPAITFAEHEITLENPGEISLDWASVVAERSSIEREVLSALACARGPLATTALCAALPRATGFRAAVRALQLAGLVVRSGSLQDDEGSLSLAHDALARLLLAQRSLRWNEARLLRALTKTGADPLAYARVLEARGHRSRARSEFERVSRMLSDAGRFVEARACARSAARWAEDREERSTLEEWTATLDAASGYASAAGDAYARAATLTEGSERQRALRLRGAEQWLIAGRYSEGRSALDAVARACGGPLATVRGVIAKTIGERLHGRIDGGEDARTRLEAGLVFVAGVGMTDPIRALAVHRENVRLAESVGDAHATLAVLEMQTMFEGAVGASRARAARASVERAVELCRAVRANTRDDVTQRSLLAAEHRVRGVSAVQFGRFEEGVRELNRAEEIQLPSDPWFWRRTVAEHFRLWGLYYCGRLSALADLAPARSWRAQRSGDRYAALDFRTQHAICAWLVADDAERASAQLDAAHGALADESGPLQTRDVVVAKVELELYRGQGRRAFDVLRSKLGASPLKDALIPEGMRVDALALRARAALAAMAEGDARAVVKASLAMALGALRIERAPWARALYEYFSGLSLLARGQSGGARGALERSVEALSAAGMRGYEACARDALGEVDSLLFFQRENVRDPRAMRRVFWPGAR